MAGGHIYELGIFRNEPQVGSRKKATLLIQAFSELGGLGEGKKR